MESPDERIRSFCNSCQQDTHHSVLYCHSCDRREGAGQYPRIIRETWHILQCMGCDLLKAYKTEDSPDFKSPREVHYPPRENRPLPSWCQQLSDELKELIGEIYLALRADCLSLAVMGARTVVDKLLTEKLGDAGGFAGKLREAVAEGLLTSDQKEIIAAAVEVGHAASHRGYRPSQQQVSDVLDIVEHSLQSWYVLQDTSQRLSQSVPRRGSLKR
ncbi:MAG: DUF4145 domain-containing protein [Planctomycetes bacterium]|nr:DUF4145 domain-containing protein [Planctomycetota bacterium]MBL7037227.1 DUF4145 domain-containing protein [Pirellulaceae bacterium]